MSVTHYIDVYIPMFTFIILHEACIRSKPKVKAKASRQVKSKTGNATKTTVAKAKPQICWGYTCRENVYASTRCMYIAVHVDLVEYSGVYTADICRIAVSMTLNFVE